MQGQGHKDSAGRTLEEKLWLSEEKAKQDQAGAEEAEWEKVALRAEAMWMNQEVSAELMSKVQD